MFFLNIFMLLGVVAIAVPILIHLLNRTAARNIDWGAIQFLFDSFVTRRRRILIEEILLMGCRCLILALLATAMARPVVPAGSNVPWLLVLPMILVAIVMFGVSFAVWQYPVWRRRLVLMAIGLMLVSGLLVSVEHWLNLKRFIGGSTKDVALIIDASGSMSVTVDGKTSLEKALAEAKRIVEKDAGKTAFSVIIGGSVPSAPVPIPISSRKEILAAMDDLKPVYGTMNMPEVLMTAAVSLEQGFNPAKQIIVLTDGQNTGWEPDAIARWAMVSEAFKRLGGSPQIVVRKLGFPSEFRNISVTDISFSRKVVGTDRDVDIIVHLHNTSKESITPKEINLKVDDKELVENAVGQIEPGATETVKFTHRFVRGGAHELTARVVVADDMAADDVLSVVLHVPSRLRVLIIDGNPSARFLEKAGAFASLAFAPGLVPAEKDKPAETNWFVGPDIKDVPEVLKMDDFSQYRAVVLADVSRLPAEVAMRLAQYVDNGGGLMIAPGERTQETFYNGWQALDGRPMLPATLDRRVVLTEKEEPLLLNMKTLSHDSLRLLMDTTHSDIDTLGVIAYWLLKEAPLEDATPVGARLKDGQPFMVERKAGKGTVLLLAISLDNRGSNLATRHTFVPFMHELLYHMAKSTGISLNLDPARRLTIPSRPPGIVAEGLKGEYFKGGGFDKQMFCRVDQNINFDWNTQPPEPSVAKKKFNVRWSGRLLPKTAGQYVFHLTVDNGARLWVDGKKIADQWPEKAPDKMPLECKGVADFEAGKTYDFKMEYFQDGGGAMARLEWEGPGQPRAVIPSACFSCVKEGQDTNIVAEVRAEVTTPEEKKLKASLLMFRDASAIARVDGCLWPGLYHIQIPKTNAVQFADLMDGSSTIPFTVRRDPMEGRFQALEKPDIDLIRKYADILEVDSLENVFKALSGTVFGKELWKYLALATFLFLLVEILLTRWIASSRRTGRTEKVVFEEKMKPSLTFLEQLKKMKAK